METENRSCNAEWIYFSDIIANNIAIEEDKIDNALMKRAVKIVNITDFIESSPLNTILILELKVTESVRGSDKGY